MLTAALRCEWSQRNASEQRRTLPLHTGSLFQREDGWSFSCRVEKKQQKSSQVTVRMFPWMELVIYCSVLQVLDEAGARFCQCCFFFFWLFFSCGTREGMSSQGNVFFSVCGVVFLTVSRSCSHKHILANSDNRSFSVTESHLCIILSSSVVLLCIWSCSTNHKKS